jgi:hypothetical protein
MLIDDNAAMAIASKNVLMFDSLYFLPKNDFNMNSAKRLFAGYRCSSVSALLCRRTVDRSLLPHRLPWHLYHF